MYEPSLRHPVWVPEINVTACNSVYDAPLYLHFSEPLDGGAGRLILTGKGPTPPLSFSAPSFASIQPDKH